MIDSDFIAGAAGPGVPLPPLSSITCPAERAEEFKNRCTGGRLNDWEKTLQAFCLETGLPVSPHPFTGQLSIGCPAEGCPLTVSPDLCECLFCGFRLVRHADSWRPLTAEERARLQSEWPALTPLSAEGKRQIIHLHPNALYNQVCEAIDCGMLAEAIFRDARHYVLRCPGFAHAFKFEGYGHQRLPGAQSPGFRHAGFTVILPQLDALMNARYRNLKFSSVQSVAASGRPTQGSRRLTGQRFRIIIPDTHTGDTAASTAAAIQAQGGTVEAFAVPAGMIASAITADATERGKILTECFN